VAIVSGLALGIDGIAHEAALHAGLSTVAVLPSGASDAVIYPPSHRPLAGRILASGGALISEFADDFTPQTWSFPQRNRIMAGLAKAILVVEAGEKSGTLITARLAMEYNREVLVVPHPIGTASGEGCNQLLRQGTTLVRSSEDILEALGIAPAAKETTTPVDLSLDEEAVFKSLAEPLERDRLIELAVLPATRVSIALSSLLIKGFVAERMGKIERA
jgi:DNA processing protein